MEKWKMYNQIFQLRELGFSKSKIAKKLGIARGTVIDYLDKDPEEMALWLASTNIIPTKTLLHSDRGFQYTSYGFKNFVEKHQIIQSMS